MWQIKMQVHDEAGLHRWQSSGPQRYATREDAQRAVRATLDRVARESPEGVYSTRLRVVLAAATLVCAVMQ
jgi:hypothetical protein